MSAVRVYARLGRPSISPEPLLRAQLLQIFHSIRSERLLMEQLDYNLLFRWFVGMDMPHDLADRDGTEPNLPYTAATLMSSVGTRSRMVEAGF